ncbi:MAG TPA: transporter [Candidatus Babeliales bacterium]|nr:transporter [Candidatus Babeliales bacterium]
MTQFQKHLVLCAVVFFTSTILGYGLPGINLGFTNILDGGPVRPNPGIYWQQYLQYYTTQRFLNDEGKSLGGLPSPRFRSLITITQFVYQSKYQMKLHGMPGFLLSIPTVIYSKINKNALGIKSSGSGFGNLGCGIYIQWPAIMHKGRPLFIHRLEFDFSTPLGKNKLPEKQINPSNTFFYCGPHWAATLYLSHKWSLSWRLHYLWNAQNEKIDFRAGDAMCLNYSLAYEVYPHLYVGPVGYALGQLHNNRANGVTIPNSKERVFGAGPGLAYFFSTDIVFFSYLYLEGGARNRPQGTSFIARVVMHF